MSFEIPDDEDRLYFINSQEWVQVPPLEPSMEFRIITIEEDKIVMKIIAKLPRFLMKKAIIEDE